MCELALCLHGLRKWNHRERGAASEKVSRLCFQAKYIITGEKSFPENELVFSIAAYPLNVRIFFFLPCDDEQLSIPPSSSSLLLHEAHVNLFSSCNTFGNERVLYEAH